MNDQKWLSLIDKMIVTRFEGRLSPFKVAGIECPVYAYKDIIIVILDVIASQRTQAIDRNVPTWTWTKSHSRCRMMHGGMSGYLMMVSAVCCLLSAVCCLLSAVCVFPLSRRGIAFFAFLCFSLLWCSVLKVHTYESDTKTAYVHRVYVKMTVLQDSSSQSLTRLTQRFTLRIAFHRASPLWCILLLSHTTVIIIIRRTSSFPHWNHTRVTLR
jgi:hypothetical protein